jgi:hypothetical protein
MNPDPAPYPTQDPGPDPDPTPEAGPDPDPTPEAGPDPDPAPDPNPDPAPDPDPTSKLGQASTVNDNAHNRAAVRHVKPFPEFFSMKIVMKSKTNWTTL